MLAYKKRGIIDKPIKPLSRSLIKKLHRAGWIINNADHFELKEGALKEIMGVSHGPTNTGFKRFFSEGVRFVPFFVRLREISKEKTCYFILASGSEELFGLDFGSNKNVVEDIEKFILS